MQPEQLILPYMTGALAFLFCWPMKMFVENPRRQHQVALIMYAVVSIPLWYFCAAPGALTFYGFAAVAELFMFFSMRSYEKRRAEEDKIARALGSLAGAIARARANSL